MTSGPVSDFEYTQTNWTLVYILKFCDFLPKTSVNHPHWQQPQWDASMATSVTTQIWDQSQTDEHSLINGAERLDKLLGQHKLALPTPRPYSSVTQGQSNILYWTCGVVFGNKHETNVLLLRTISGAKLFHETIHYPELPLTCSRDWIIILGNLWSFTSAKEDNTNLFGPLLLSSLWAYTPWASQSFCSIHSIKFKIF